MTFSASLCRLLLFSPRGSGTDFEKAAGGTEGARADEADSLSVSAQYMDSVGAPVSSESKDGM